MNSRFPALDKLSLIQRVVDPDGFVAIRATPAAGMICVVAQIIQRLHMHAIVALKDTPHQAIGQGKLTLRMPK
jgi:hypothetical protein